jgi:hypothetical protein
VSHGLPTTFPAPPPPLPGRTSAGPRRSAAVPPGRRSPAAHRCFPTNPRPQIGDWCAPQPTPPIPQPIPPPEWLNSGEPRRPARPGTTLRNRSSFSKASLQLVTQIVKVFWLFLVNCVENHIKIRKMQNQFFWIRCELSYNFCYSCLS